MLSLSSLLLSLILLFYSIYFAIFYKHWNLSRELHKRISPMHFPVPWNHTYKLLPRRVPCATKSFVSIISLRLKLDHIRSHEMALIYMNIDQNRLHRLVTDMCSDLQFGKGYKVISGYWTIFFYYFPVRVKLRGPILTELQSNKLLFKEFCWWIIPSIKFLTE